MYWSLALWSWLCRTENITGRTRRTRKISGETQRRRPSRGHGPPRLDRDASAEPRREPRQKPRSRAKPATRTKENNGLRPEADREEAGLQEMLSVNRNGRNPAVSLLSSARSISAASSSRICACGWGSKVPSEATIWRRRGAMWRDSSVLPAACSEEKRSRAASRRILAWSRAAGLSAVEGLGGTDRLARGGEGGGSLAARFLELVLAVVRLGHPRQEVAPAGLHLAETQGGPQALVHVRAGEIEVSPPLFRAGRVEARVREAVDVLPVLLVVPHEVLCELEPAVSQRVRAIVVAALLRAGGEPLETPAQVLDELHVVGPLSNERLVHAERSSEPLVALVLRAPPRAPLRRASRRPARDACVTRRPSGPRSGALALDARAARGGRSWRRRRAAPGRGTRARRAAARAGPAARGSAGRDRAASRSWRRSSRDCRVAPRRSRAPACERLSSQPRC